MAANVEKLLLKIKADLADLKQLQIELATVRKETKETESSINSAFGNVAKIFGAAKLKGVFDSAVADARQLEKTILGLQATARLTGNNFRELNAQVKNLASDGVLSIDQASQSMKVLLAQGVQADKAFQLVDAAKKVGAFNNIVGNTGQSVQDFIKFMQTGSAELAENLDPSLVKVIKSLGGYERVANDAAAKQKLVNAVIEKGKNLSADYSKFLDSGAQAQVNFDSATLKLSQTLGEKLAPAYNTVQNALAKFINGISDFLGGMNSVNVSIAAGATLLITSLVGVGGALAFFSKAAAAAFFAALGPISILIAAVAALTIAWRKFFGDPSQENARKRYEADREAITQLINKQKELQAVNQRTEKQERELVESKEALRKKAKELGLDFDELVKKAGSYEKALQQLSKAAKQRAVDEENAPLLATRARVAKRLNERIDSQARAVERYGAAGRSAEQDDAIRRGINELADIDSRLIKLDDDDETNPLKKDLAAGGKSGAKFIEQRYQEAEEEMLKALGDFEKTVARINAREALALATLGGAPEKNKRESDSQFADRLKRFEEEEKRIRDAADVQRASAGKRADESLTTTISALRQSQAEFIEDRTTAELEALKQKTIQEEGNVYKLLNAKQISEKQAESQLQKIREANARKTGKIHADAFAQTLQAANTIASGIDAIRGGSAGAFGQVFTGAGNAGSALNNGFLRDIGNIAPVVGAGGAIIDGLKKLFGGNFEDEQRQRLERAEKQRAEQVRLLELQLLVQKSSLAIQEAQAKLPFEDLQRELRLIEIVASRDKILGLPEDQVESDRQSKRSAAISKVIAEQSQTIQGGRFYTETEVSPEGLIKFLSDRAAEKPFLDAINQAVGTVFNLRERNNREDVAYSEFETVYNQIRGLLTNLPKQFTELIGPLIATGPKNTLINTPFFTGTQSSLEYHRFIDTIPGILAGFNSEIASDTEIGELLLSAIEQSNQVQLEIKTNTKKTAENTNKLDLLDPRKLSFIDLVRNSVFSQGLKVDFQKVQLPTAVSSTILASSASPAVPSDTLAAMRRMVDLMDEANDYLAVIAENTNKNSTDDVDISDNRLIGRINSIKGRSIS